MVIAQKAHAGARVVEEYGGPGEAVVLVRPARAAAAPPSVFTPVAGPILWAPPPPPESDLNRLEP